MQCRSQDAVQLSKTPSCAACAYLALSTVRDSGSHCLYSFSNKQTSLEMHTAPVTLTDRSAGTEDVRFYQWTWAASACGHRSSGSQGCPCLSVSPGSVRVTLAQDAARWSQHRACPAMCYASASGALSWPKTRLWTPTLPPSQKAIRDPAKLLITFWKKSVVKD